MAYTVTSGTNVSQIETGTLKSQTLSDTPIVGSVNIVFTVPTGKKWIVKTGSSYASGSTVTVSYNNLEVSPTGAVGDYVSVATAGSVSLKHNVPHQLVLPAGAKVRGVLNCSVVTTAGTWNQQIMYAEFDAL